MMLLPKKYGDITLMRRLGTDGVAETYAGIMDVPAGRPVLVRRLMPYVARDPDLLEAVEARIQDLSAVRHPVLVSVDDYVERNGERLILEEWYESVSLASIVEWCTRRDQTVPHNVFLNIATQVCNGLEALHGRPGKASGAEHVLHLGLRPSAVRLTRTGKLIVGDYGLIRSPTSLPHSGVAAVPHRMEHLSPEQTHQDRELTPASDIFSLGSLLYEFLTLRPLFRAQSNLQTIHRVRKAEVAAQLLQVKEILPGLDKVLYRALSQNPRHRYQRPFVLREDLRGLMAGYSFAHITENTLDFLEPIFKDRAHASPTATADDESTGALLASIMSSSIKEESLGQPVPSLGQPITPQFEPPPRPNTLVPDDPDAYASLLGDADEVPVDDGTPPEADFSVTEPRFAAPGSPDYPPSMDPPHMAEVAYEETGEVSLDEARALASASNDSDANDSDADDSDADDSDDRPRALEEPDTSWIPRKPASSWPDPSHPGEQPDESPTDVRPHPTLAPDNAPGATWVDPEKAAPSSASREPEPVPAPSASSGLASRVPSRSGRLADRVPPPAPQPPGRSEAAQPPPQPAQHEAPTPTVLDDLEWREPTPVWKYAVAGAGIAGLLAMMIVCAGVSIGGVGAGLFTVSDEPAPVEIASTAVVEEDSEPAPAEASPEPAPEPEPEPTASSSRPTASSSRPTASSSRPTASSSRPTASSSRPTASSSRPTASSSRPTASSSRPTASEPAATARAASEPAATARAASEPAATARAASEPAATTQAARAPAATARASTARSEPDDDFLASLAPEPVQEVEDQVIIDESITGVTLDEPDADVSVPVIEESVLVSFDEVRGQLDDYSARAYRGGLSQQDREVLEAAPIDDPEYTTAMVILYQDAKSRGDLRARQSYIDAAMRLPENQYNPLILSEAGAVAIAYHQYDVALARADQADRYWARIPSDQIFKRRAQIYEIQAAAHQGRFYESEGEDLDELNHAIRSWERYLEHVNTKSRRDMASRADEQLAKLYDMQRRLE